ncbi:MAG: CRISPR-associated protein Cas4 [Anaerolineae bacterium]|nr:CRISPR-associated protein Cas4 [Thermoflexales bacterium]MDW8408706.1 CRISPR-associated protein Cas4 [Anaerolineae bacterium]
MSIWLIALLIMAGLALWWIAGRLRQQIGLPEGQIIYSDAGAWRRNQRRLYSARHRLVGKPDYLVRDGAKIIPVEVKSGQSPHTPHHGHVLQLAAYCLLVEETLGVAPAHGILQYADRQFTIPYTPELRRELLTALDALRQAVDLPTGPARSHSIPARCASCGVRTACDQSLA